MALLWASPMGHSDPLPGLFLPQCETLSRDLVILDALSRTRGFTAEQKDFLDRHLFPLVGLRTLFGENFNRRDIVANENSLEIPFAGERTLKIEWSDGLSAPRVITTDTHRILQLPRGLNLDTLAERGQNVVMRFLVGHSAHPFSKSNTAGRERTSLGESALVPRNVQLQGVAAAIQGMHAGHNTYMYVSPTGTGKTLVLTEILKHRLLSPNGGRKLNIVAADTTDLANQLHGDLNTLRESMRNPGTGEYAFDIIQWGGEHGSQSIQELTERVAANPRPVVVISTTQSVRARVEQGNPENNMSLLRRHLHTYVHDEAHHTGAEETISFLHPIIHHRDSHAYLLGLSATPSHHVRDVRGDLFRNRDFWAYLDTPNEFVRRTNQNRRRDIADVEAQLQIAIDRGELTPVNGIFFINRNRLAPPGQSIFSQTPRGATILNPDYIRNVATAISPLFNNHQQGFVTVPSVNDARELARILNGLMPGKRFAAIYDGVPDREGLINRFKRPASERRPGDDSVDFLISVNVLDEGFDHAPMSLYVDLNNSVGPRQRLQRMGRVLRLADGKPYAQMAFLQDFFSPSGLRHNLRFVDGAVHGQFGALALGDDGGGGNGGQGGGNGNGNRRPPVVPAGLDTSVIMPLDQHRSRQAADNLAREMHRMWVPEEIETQAQLVNNYWRGRGTDPTGTLPLPSSDSRAYPAEARIRAIIDRLRNNPGFLACLDPAPRLRILRHAFSSRAKTAKRSGTPAEIAHLINDYVEELIDLPARRTTADADIHDLLTQITVGRHPAPLTSQADRNSYQTFRSTLTQDAQDMLQIWLAQQGTSRN